MQSGHKNVVNRTKNKKLIRIWDSERELFLRQHLQPLLRRRAPAKAAPLRRSWSFKVTDLGTSRKLIYDFLLVINTDLPPILHRFRDIAFDRSKIAKFGYPLAFNRPDGRVPCIISSYTWYIGKNYTVSQKKVPTFKLSVTLSNLNRFSKFLDRWKAYGICYKTVWQWHYHLSLGTLLHYLGKLKFKFSADIQQIWKKMQTNCNCALILIPLHV